MRVPAERSPIKVLLLILITCSLYYFYWVYVTSEEVDEALGEKDIPPIVHLLLAFFTAGFWLFYWDWQLGQKIVRLQERAGLPRQDNSPLYLVFDLLGAGPIAGVGIVVPLIQQQQLNEVYRAAQRQPYIP